MSRSRRTQHLRGLAVVAAVLILPTAPLRAQTTGTDNGQTAATDSSIDNNLDAAEADGDEPKRQLVSWNQLDGRFLTLRVGGGFLYDFAAYDQNAAGQAQAPLSAASAIRDFRLLAKGKFKFAPRFSYTIGYMRDVPAQTWRFRQTGIMMDVPELHGDLFVGRTKEGFSTSKIMVGYQGWTMERSTANDAFLPILADGFKWTGTAFRNRLSYNLGWFVDTLFGGQNESYVKNDQQFAARAVWLPFMGQEDRPLLHLAVEYRYGASNNGYLQYRSRPESYLAQEYFLDTGKFPANHADTLGFEAYYRPGPFMMGSEYYINQVDSPQTGNPVFHGGEIFAAYLLTGETRPYNSRGGYFERISPARPVFSGGPGAWELVLRYSYTDLDDGTIHGGKFWRITPMVNWHLSDNVRLEFAYGYGVLDRLGMHGATQFFQSRLQLQL